LILFGIIINLWTDSLFKKKQTTVKPHEMPNFFIDSGPFRLSRHPVYLGMMSILLGVAIFPGSLNRYVDYRKKVRRWI
jgi:protein-S-isoprenylcysteine O-methyltransferase Ste14